MKCLYNLFSSDHFLFNICSNQSKCAEEKQHTLKVMTAVKPHFLSPYKDGGFWIKTTRQIKGVVYVVNRFNHGLAHGLRQGALAKDILEIVSEMQKKYELLDHPELYEMVEWIHSKMLADKNFIYMVEFAASFQRSGRQSEGPSSQDMEKYKLYERQDALNFRNAANSSDLFKNEQDIKIFEEAILWENKGELNEESIVDLKFLRRILHAAHTFDLRRMPSFNAERIQNDGIQQLLGCKTSHTETKHSHQIQHVLWDRAGKYLSVTGDRDLNLRSTLSNLFFYQTANPKIMVEAIHKIRTHSIASIL
jgi:hypothetical protein